MNIAVLVSGGVDSSVALALLKEQGHTVTAFYLKIWLEDDISSLGRCPWETDLTYIRNVCAALNVALEIVPLQQEYWNFVVSYTLSEVKAGRTPNPDIFCNQRIKFGCFLDWIDKSGIYYDKIATGHYAQIHYDNSYYYLKQTPDLVKDQTYFLSYLSQQQLSRLLFPIGHLTKPEVRNYAHAMNLPTKDRKDSQGICFLGKFKFHDFIRHYLGDKTGLLIDFDTHKTVGKHQGFWYYTIGQRQGIGLPGGPWYVVAKDVEHNYVYISRHYHALQENKERSHFRITAINWFDGTFPTKSELNIKIRHGASIHGCIISKHDNEIHVQLKNADQGIASGQFAVFYDGQICLGGGIMQVD